MTLASEFAKLDRALGALSAAVRAREAERRLDAHLDRAERAPRGAWLRRLAWRRLAAARGGRIASALGPLRALDGYERVKVSPGRWAIFAVLPFEGRVTVAELRAPVLNRANYRAEVRVVEVAPMPAEVVSRLAERAERGAFEFVPCRARRMPPTLEAPA